MQKTNKIDAVLPGQCDVPHGTISISAEMVSLHHQPQGPLVTSTLVFPPNLKVLDLERSLATT